MVTITTTFSSCDEIFFSTSQLYFRLKQVQATTINGRAFLHTGLSKGKGEEKGEEGEVGGGWSPPILGAKKYTPLCTVSDS